MKSDNRSGVHSHAAGDTKNTANSRKIEEVMRARRRAPAVSNTNEYKAGSLVELATLPYVTLAPVSSDHPG